MDQILRQSSTQRIERRKAEARTPMRTGHSEAGAEEELHRAMPLRQDLNQRSGQSTAENNGQSPHTLSSTNPLDQPRAPKRLNPVSGRALTINVLDSQNVHNVINMVYNVNSLVQRQYERHSDASLAQKRQQKIQLSKRKSVAGAEVSFSPKLKTHQPALVRPKQSLNQLKEKQYQITSKIRMIRREKEPPRKNFNPNDTGWTGIGSYSSASGRVPGQRPDHFMSRERYSTQDSGFAGIFNTMHQGTPHRQPRNVSKNMLNTHEASHHHNLSIFEELAGNFEDLDANVFNNKSHQDGHQLPLHRPSTDIYDFSQPLPTSSKYNKSISTMNTDKIRSLRHQASPFMQKKNAQNILEESSTNWQGHLTHQQSRDSFQEAGDAKYNAMQGQTFGEQFALDAGGKRPDGADGRVKGQADPKATGGFGAKEATVLPSIKGPQASPFTKTKKGAEMVDKLAHLNSNTVSRKSFVAEEAEPRLNVKVVSKQKKREQVGVLHFKGAFDDGVPEGMGPNSKNQMNVYETLKATDKNYDKMLNVANDILRSQQSNPHSGRQHIINAQGKFYGSESQNPSELARRQQKQATQKRQATTSLGPEQQDDSANAREKRKYEAMAANMYQQHMQINNILNRYNASSMTLNQASKSLLKGQIDKWARRIKMAKESRTAMASTPGAPASALSRSQPDQKSKESLNVSKAQSSLERLPTVSNRKASKSPQKSKSKSRIAARSQLDEVGEGLMKDEAKLDEQLVKFSKDLFQFWDTRDYGKLNIKAISNNFLALGLALTTEQVIQIFQPAILSNLRNEGTLSKDQYLNSEGLVDLKKLTIDKVSHFEITVSEFAAIFKGDDYSPKMIALLNEEARELQRIADEEKKRQEELQRQNKKLEELVGNFKEQQPWSAPQKPKPTTKQSTETFIAKLKAKAGVGNGQDQKQPQNAPESDLELGGRRKGGGSELSLRTKGPNSQRELLDGQASGSRTQAGPQARGKSSRTLAVLKQGLLERVEEYKKGIQQREKDKSTNSQDRRSSAVSVDRSKQSLSVLLREKSASKPLEKTISPARSSLGRTPRSIMAAARLKQPTGAQANATDPALNAVDKRKDALEKQKQENQQQKESKALEQEYMQALLGAHACNLNEIRIDHNDAVRAFLLDTLLHNIRKHYRPFREDLAREKEILFSSNLEPQHKLDLVQQRQLYEQQLQRTYGSGRSFQIFKEIMLRIVAMQGQSEKALATQEKELKAKMERRKKRNFRQQYEQQRRHLLDKLTGAQTQSAIDEQQRIQKLIDRNEERKIAKEIQKHRMAEQQVDYGLEPDHLIDDCPEEALPIQQLMRALVTEQFKQKRQKLKLTFPNQRMSLLLRALELWWREVDTTHALEAPIKEFSELMQRKGIVAKSFETVRMIKLTIGDKIEPDGVIRYSQYMRLFARPLLRAALTNVYYYIKKIANRDGTDSWPSGAVALAGGSGEGQGAPRAHESHILYVLKLQRSLALSGMKPTDSLGMGFDAANIVDAVIFQQQEREQETGTRDLGTEPLDDFKKINLMKKRLDQRMTKLREDPYNKVSLRGQTSREKHAELRAKRDGYQSIVDNFDTYQELLDNAATYGPDSAKTLNTLAKRDIFMAQDKSKVEQQQTEAGRLNAQKGAARAGTSKVDLTENKISYQICKENLKRELWLLHFLDEELRQNNKVHHTGTYTSKVPSTGPKEGGEMPSTGAGGLSDITSIGTGNRHSVRHLTQGLQMSMELNMISSDSEGEQEAESKASPGQTRRE